MAAPTDDAPAADPQARVAEQDWAPERARRPARRGAPLPISATVAALWAAVSGLLPVAVLAAVGAIGTGAAPASVARIAVGAWLLGHGVPVTTATDRITLVPLGITAWVAWRLARAGVHAGRPAGAPRAASAWPAVRAGTAVAVVYAAVGAGTAILALTADVEVEPGRAAATFGGLAGVCAVVGGLRHAWAGRRLVRRAPRVLTDAIRAGVAAAAFLLAAGAAAAGLALALAAGEASQMLAAYGAGLAAAAGITALCLAYLPNLAVWSAAYLVGPGFAVGTGTVVSPEDVVLGPVPALPVLAALPSRELTGIWPTLLLGAPIVAGLAAGVLLGRRPSGWPTMLGAAVLAGPVAGGLIHLAMIASSGALGSGRLTDLGPSDARVPVFTAGVVGVGTVLGALVRRSGRAQRF